MLVVIIPQLWYFNFMKPEDLNEKDLCWLAGLLEGEAYFGYINELRIKLIMTDKDVVDRVANYFGVKVYTRAPRKPHHKVGYLCSIYGKKAKPWFEALRPLMGLRRYNKISQCLHEDQECKQLLKFKKDFRDSQRKPKRWIFDKDLAKRYLEGSVTFPEDADTT
jgi:hypothetical protein